MPMNKASPEILAEIRKRKSFAIISHPDAGKTTLTEKLLLFGNAIHMVGQVKAKRDKRFATSDWMEIEKQRGISVASSVMQFNYDGYAFNLLDTPGHEDFSEDTYRVLTAVDSALMVIDAAKGIETQTKKLFQVCRDRKIPIVTFINKCDREGKDPFELIDEIEHVLGLKCTVASWPIGQGSQFAGVYDNIKKRIRLFAAHAETRNFAQEIVEDLQDPRLKEKIELALLDKLSEDLELLEGAGTEFQIEEFLKGSLSPVYFGSAINNFGVQELLHSFVEYAPAPQARESETRIVEAEEAKFSGVIFKIQANMDPKHRDRVAFLRIVSGKYSPGMEAYQVRKERKFKISNAIQFLSKERNQIDGAYAGDIIGLYDRGNLMIGDTITEGEAIRFTGIPLFSPELFSRVELKNPIKAKQLQKGLEQLAEEGSSQIFHRKNTSDTYIGVVGQLQFEVVKFRLQNEYGAEAIFTPLNFSCSRWYHSEDKEALKDFEVFYQNQIVYDVRNYPMILFKNEWEKDYVSREKPKIKFYSSLINYEQECLH